MVGAQAGHAHTAVVSFFGWSMWKRVASLSANIAKPRAFA